MADDNGTNDGNNGEGNANGNGAGANDPNQTGQTSGSERVFTQRELDLIINDRLNRERSKFADFDALKEKASKFDEMEQARLSETERLTQQFQTAEQRAVAAETALRGERLRLAVMQEATKAGAVDIDAVYALLDRDALVNSKGEVEGVAEAVTALLDAKTYLRAGTPKPTGDIGAGARGSGTSGGQFTRSQLQDPAFYKANEPAILAAASKGLIVDDVS